MSGAALGLGLIDEIIQAGTDVVAFSAILSSSDALK
jgi:hypothetical protein